MLLILSGKLKPGKMSKTCASCAAFYKETTLVALLKSCAKQKDLRRGSRIHADIAEMGLLKTNVFIGSTLVNLYVKCGALAKAKEVFDELPIRDVVTWTSLIAGYAQHGHGEEALDFFEGMQREGLYPTAITFTCILKACGSVKATEKGIEIHAEIIHNGLLEENEVLGTALVDMYAKCGALENAQHVFGELSVRDLVSWTALISGYAQHGHGEKALECFGQMQHDGFSPNAVTLACILQACGSIGAAEKGKEIHAAIVKEGMLENDSVLGSALVGLYAKCGALSRAQQVFDELLPRNVVAWTALITGYCHHGHGEKALNCFEKMKHEGISPNAMTFACMLKACASIRAAEQGKALHIDMVRKGLLGNDIVLMNALVDMYAKCGNLEKAQEVFDEMEVRNVVSWNALVSGYCQHGHGEEALICFEQMQGEDFWPDEVTLLCILQACGCIGAIGKGRDIHAEIVREDLLAGNRPIGNALVDMYAKCGLLAKSQKVFDELPVQDVVSWNALIAGYCQHGHNEEALNRFEQMRSEGLTPVAPTFARILKVCGSIGAAEKGKEIHNEIIREGLLGKDSVLGTALVDMYAKCGALAKSQEVFDELPCRDVVAWTALILGYCQHGHGEEALTCFQSIQSEGLCSDVVTLACILKACGNVGATGKGEEVHAEIVKEGLLGKDSVLGSALVDMYAKSGALTKAHEVFDKLSYRDVVSWTALIAGYAQAGKHNLVLTLFNKMIEEAIEPNSITFTVVLNACSYSGLLDEGQIYFEIMNSTYNIIPSLAHYNCMVCLFAHAGHFDEAIELMTKTPVLNYLPAWFALLGACGKWENVKLGNWAFSHAVRLDEKAAVAYVRMSNLYIAAGMHEDKFKINFKKTDSEAAEDLGQCWTDSLLFVEHTGLSLENNGPLQSRIVCAM